MSYTVTHTITTTLASSPVWTSDLYVQKAGRVNVTFRPGSAVQSPVVSAASCILTLQRKLPNEAFYRTVATWTVLQADGMDAAIESISVSPEPESCVYRLGCDTAEWYSVGTSNIRLGT